MEKQDYRFIFRFNGEIGEVRRTVNAGMAEVSARDLAELVGKKYGAEDVECVWAGPVGAQLPKRLIRELGR